MTQSTVYPEKIKIIGDKVYVRDLNSVVERNDENENIMYEYDEEIYTKDEYIKMLKDENDQLRSEVDQLILDNLMRWFNV